MNIANDNINIAELSKIEDVCLSIVDKNGKFICYSKGCENIEHYKQCDVLGKKPNDLYHQAEISEKEKSRSLIMETLKRKKAITRNINVYETNHNKTITSICSTYPVFDENHKLHFVLCVYNEITDYLNMMSVINKQKLEIESRHKFEFSNGTKYIFDSIIGESVALKKCINQAKTAATTKEAVLLYGETGTGKELFAQSIHNQSARAKINFVAVNCATIPENLLEATLFGTCKGSFTGAVHSKGLLEEAKGSTLFLDEINSMDLKMQSKLLRVLETEKYRKVGASEEQRCDVRIISAINEDPFKAIAANRFRSDLYYRLAVFTINIPPLNARKKDLMLLSDYFIENLSPMLGKKIARLSKEVSDIFMCYSWPGNIRELRHVLHQSICMTRNDELVLQKIHLPEYLLYPENSEATAPKRRPEATAKEPDLKKALAAYEKKLIETALKKNHNNVTKTAAALKITRQSLHHKINRYTIKI